MSHSCECSFLSTASYTETKGNDEYVPSGTGSYLRPPVGVVGEGAEMACLRVRTCAGAGCSLREEEAGTAVVKRGSSSSNLLSLLEGCLFFFDLVFLILPAFWGGMSVSWPWWVTTWVR